MKYVECYLDLLLSVLLADGKIDEDEKSLFYQIIENSGIDEHIKNKYQDIRSVGKGNMFSCKHQQPNEQKHQDIFQ